MEDRDKEPWKLVFLIFIVLMLIYKLVGLLHQNRLLHMPDAKLEEKYKNLPEEVSELIPMTQLVEARLYNRGVNCISISWEILRCIFEFTVILLDVPALIWYGWLDVLENDGHCGGDVTADNVSEKT